MQTVGRRTDESNKESPGAKDKKKKAITKRKATQDRSSNLDRQTSLPSEYIMENASLNPGAVAFPASSLRVRRVSWAHLISPSPSFFSVERHSQPPSPPCAQTGRLRSASATATYPRRRRHLLRLCLHLPAPPPPPTAPSPPPTRTAAAYPRGRSSSPPPPPPPVASCWTSVSRRLLLPPRLSPTTGNPRIRAPSTPWIFFYFARHGFLRSASSSSCCRPRAHMSPTSDEDQTEVASLVLRTATHGRQPCGGARLNQSPARPRSWMLRR
jgi:hypothetical protein